jgi:hypothetical protein
MRASAVLKLMSCAFWAWNAIGILACVGAMRWAINDAMKRDWVKP